MVTLADNSNNTLTFTTTTDNRTILSFTHCEQHKSYCEHVDGLLVEDSNDQEDHPTYMGWKVVEEFSLHGHSTKLFVRLVPDNKGGPLLDVDMLGEQRLVGVGGAEKRASEFITAFQRRGKIGAEGAWSEKLHPHL